MERADKQAIANWFSTWEKLIGRVDYALARDLFDSDVIGFGTHMDTVKGLDHLEQDQWRHVWPTIDGFRFDLDTLECMIFPDRLQGVGIVICYFYKLMQFISYRAISQNCPINVAIIRVLGFSGLWFGVLMPAVTVTNAPGGSHCGLRAIVSSRFVNCFLE